NLADNGRLALLYRYETRLHMMYRRSFQNLLLMKKSPLPNEPKTPFVSNNPAPAPPPDSPVSDVGQTIAVCGLSTAAPVSAPTPLSHARLATRAPDPGPRPP